MYTTTEEYNITRPLLADTGIFFGLNNQSMPALSSNAEADINKLINNYCRLFPIIEWNTNPQRLIDESVLIALFASSLNSIFIRIECNANIFRENGIIFSDHWRQFISLLSDFSTVKKNIILSFDRNTTYSEELLESFLILREELTPINLLFECENHSWKNPSALKVIRGGKVRIVQRDMPDLAGFNFQIANPDKKECYLRLLGRNKVNWFSNEKKIRYQYDYAKAELNQIISKINSLRLSFENVYVIAANTPPQSALANINQLIQLYHKP
jgi:hypothetical protein